MRNVIRKGVDSYKVCSLLVFNTIVVFAVVNVAIFVAYRVKDGNGLLGRPRLSNHVVKMYGMPALRGVYPGYKDDDVRLLIKETWDRGLEYDPFTQSKERAYAGKWVNVHEAGFRLSKNNGPWPPDPKNLNIFLFGGSTTFGYGVADDHTIASHLQEFLECQSGREVKVYNFGSCYFFSSQERTRFVNFLAQGVVPDVAIFIDGLNDFLKDSGKPFFTDALGKMWDARESSGVVEGILSQLPIKRFSDSIKARIALNRQARATPNSESYDASKRLAEVLTLYAQNKHLIEAAARAYDVRPAFVWQPIPSYHYHLRHYLSDPDKEWLRASTQVGYTMMGKIVKENPEHYTQDFLWLADIQEHCTESLYVDSFHYTDKFSNVIAGHIGRFLLKRQIIKDGDTRRQASKNMAVSRERPVGN